MTALPPGGNLALAPAPRYRITFAWEPARPAGGELDVCAFLLTADGRVRGDGDFVFYNQTRGDGVILESGAQPGFIVQPAAVPAAIVKIAVCATLAGGTFAQVRALVARVCDDGGRELARFAPATELMGEAALIVLELYRHRDGWKVRALGQGFAGGLAPLARHFGIAVAEEPPAPHPLQPASPEPERKQIAGLAYALEQRGAYPLLRLELPLGRQVRAEAGAMVAMSATVEVAGQLRGGVLGGLSRLLSGESLFLQTLTARRGAGAVYLAPSAPGAIAALAVTPEECWRVQRGGFLAASDGVEIGTHVQNVTQGLWGGAGWAIVAARGHGVLFVTAFGALHWLEVAPGEHKIIDNGHLVAWPQHMQYEVTLGGGGLMAAVTSGERLVCRCHGPGRVLVQTRQPGLFGHWVTSLLPGGS